MEIRVTTPPAPESRPATTKNDSEFIEKILSKLDQHDGEKLDENYVLDIWGKHLGDKGKFILIQ